MSNNAHELSNRLLNALDNNYNVVDMQTVNEIITILEKLYITKELLETTRLGKHVNELRRKTSDPTLARRAKVLVKRWRDLVIPTVASPGHTGSNRSSAERTVRRLGGTPLTSPALQRQGLSPAVSSPRPSSRPAWGGYESDSQDVILVDDDPPPPPPPPPPPHTQAHNNVHTPLTSPAKRPPSPEPLYDEKKAKRDKKPKKKRGHGRAGSGTESPGGVTIPAPAPSPSVPAPTLVPAPVPVPAPAPPAAAPSPWRDRNGTAERRRNGCRKGALDSYSALVKRMPKVGDKKVKTTQELLEQIQSRGARASPPGSPGDPNSPDVMLIEPDVVPMKVESPLRNGGTSPRPPTPPPPPPLPPLEDEREYHECTCGEDTAEEHCPAARRSEVHPLHVLALHNAYLPGINGTRAPTHPHQFAVRKPIDPERSGLFTTVVPLYKYSDYADDYCAKNMSKVPLCTHLPWTEFAPDPPDLPPPPSPPPLIPYPIDEEPVKEVKEEVDSDATSVDSDDLLTEKPEIDSIKPEMISVPNLEPSERLKAPLLSPEEETQFNKNEAVTKMEVEESFVTEHQDHRTVERTKENIDGQTLFNMVRDVADSIPYDYDQIYSTPVVTLPEEELQAIETLEEAMNRAEEETVRDDLGRPLRPTNFTEWHECARLGELIALPYVVID